MSGNIAQLTNLSGQELETRCFPPIDRIEHDESSLSMIVSELKGLVTLSEEAEANLVDFLRKVASRADDCPSAAAGPYSRIKLSPLCGYIRQFFSFSISVCECSDKAVRSSIHQFFKAKLPVSFE